MKQNKFTNICKKYILHLYSFSGLLIFFQSLKAINCYHHQYYVNIGQISEVGNKQVNWMENYS